MDGIFGFKVHFSCEVHTMAPPKKMEALTFLDFLRKNLVTFQGLLVQFSGEGTEVWRRSGFWCWSCVF